MNPYSLTFSFTGFREYASPRIRVRLSNPTTYFPQTGRPVRRRTLCPLPTPTVLRCDDLRTCVFGRTWMGSRCTWFGTLSDVENFFCVSKLTYVNLLILRSSFFPYECRFPQNESTNKFLHLWCSILFRAKLKICRGSTLREKTFFGGTG